MAKFNVGNDHEEVNIETLAVIISDMFGNQVEIKKVDGPNDAYAKADPKRRCPDLAKIRAKLGYIPRVNLKSGLKRFILWAVEEYGIKNSISVNLKKEKFLITRTIA